jgi:3-dehydroquinate synthase
VPQIEVRLGEQSYPIEIEAGALARLGTFATALRRATKAVVVTDANVGLLYEAPVRAALAAAGLAVDVLTIPPGEDSKSIAVAETLYTALLERRIDRRALLVALGGGVVGDLTGFVAATVLRGVDYLQAPTTLLAQVDSSVGGKTGINHPLGKNLIGAFHQPVGVLIDPATLTTLPCAEYVAGLAEVVKTAVIYDAPLFTFLEEHVRDLLALDPETLTRAVTRCCQIKAAVVEADPRETTGLRAILNYGHTIGHALEAVSGYGRYRHGEAVAVGMTVAARIAATRGLIDAAFADRQTALLEALGLPVRAAELADARLVPALSRDKKVEGGRLRFVLPVAPGRVALFDDVSETEVRAALHEATGGTAP